MVKLCRMCKYQPATHRVVRLSGGKRVKSPSKSPELCIICAGRTAGALNVGLLR